MLERQEGPAENCQLYPENHCTETSSTRNDVGSEMSSIARNCTRIVCPAKAETLNGPRSTYTPAVPELRLPNVASVASNVPYVLRTLINNLSNTVFVVVSLVVTLSQKFRFVDVPAGMVICKA